MGRLEGEVCALGNAKMRSNKSMQPTAGCFVASFQMTSIPSPQAKLALASGG